MKKYRIVHRFYLDDSTRFFVQWKVLWLFWIDVREAQSGYKTFKEAELEVFDLIGPIRQNVCREYP